MELLRIPHYAILSGLFGTAASVFGKFISYSDAFIENISIDTDRNVKKKKTIQIENHFFLWNECIVKMIVDFWNIIKTGTDMVVTENHLYRFDGAL